MELFSWASTPTRSASLPHDIRSPIDDGRALHDERAETGAPAAPPTGIEPDSWLLRLAANRANYWATYATDLLQMLFFLWWDAVHVRIGAAAVAGLFAAGLFLWTFSEYAFHRWMYHIPGLPITRWGHDQHHADPTAYFALPFLATPIVFLPLQWWVATKLGVHGFSALLAGWFAGAVAYNYLHHALHRHRLPFAWYRHLQSQHRIHHAIPDVNFGVTMRYWDRVFGTAFKKR